MDNKENKTTPLNYADEVKPLPPAVERAHLVRDVEEARRNGLPLSGDFKNFDFADFDLRQVIFERADLSGADFTKAKLGQTVFVGCNLESADFSNVEIEMPPYARQGDGIVFNASHLKNTNMRNMKAPYSVFSNLNTLGHAPMVNEMASMKGHPHSEMLMTGTILRGADFSHSNFNNVVAAKADARETNFGLVALNNTTFIDVDMKGAHVNFARARATINGMKHDY
jgi:uncharacterized protein YjbI with pentapeptide repeats